MHEISTSPTHNMTVENYTTVDSFASFWVPLIIAVWIFFVVILLANTLVLVAVKLLRTKMRMKNFIINLAISDILVSLTVVLGEALLQMALWQWHTSDALCKLTSYLQTLALHASNYSLVALCIDRMFAVAWPLYQGHFQEYRTPILIGLVWFMSSLFAFVGLLYTVSEYKSAKYCLIDRSITDNNTQGKIFFTLITLSVWLLPAVIVTVCCIKIVYVICERDQKISNITSAEETMLKRSKRSKKKSIQLMLATVLAFFLCNVAYYAHMIHQIYTDSEDATTSALLQSFLPLNSAVNPLMYFFLNPEAAKVLCQAIGICSKIRKPKRAGTEKTMEIFA